MKKTWLTIGVAFLLIVLALFFDRNLIFWVTEHRVSWLNTPMVFFTDFGLLFGVLLFFVALYERHWISLVILFGLTFVAALEISQLLKLFFENPRPYETWSIVPLKTDTGYSFPSMHAAFIFSVLPLFKGHLTRYRWVWTLFAFLIAFSRVYVGAHYVSDVLAGAFLGYGIGSLMAMLEDRFHLSHWIAKHLRDNFEVRRQAAHLFIGLGLLLLLQWHLITPGILLGILCAGGFLSLLSLRWQLPGLQAILAIFERPQQRKTFPGQGSFFLVLGVLLSMLLFPEPIALAAIAIMALGDSVTNVFGRYFGEIRLPYNRKKTVDGVLIGIGAATLGALFFVPLGVALAASTMAMFVETWDLKIGVPIDDNVLVPLVAGGVMLVMI